MAAAGLVSELLDAAPRLDILVTSREALHLTGENRVEVQGLPVSDAAELFLRRARAVRQDLAEHPPEREAVQRICLRLDGLPLALELAAARVALFSVPALEARLAQRLDLPEGARDLPDRQRTLRATIDWSYQLLSASERELFCRLARSPVAPALKRSSRSLPIWEWSRSSRLRRWSTRAWYAVARTSMACRGSGCWRRSGVRA